MPGKKKKYNARFPPARIKKIMQTDEEVGKVAQAVPVIISRALELFAENLLNQANKVTLRRGARTLTPSHLKFCIENERKFDFLRDMVTNIPDLQEDELEMEGDIIPIQPISKPRPKPLNTNGKPEANENVFKEPPSRESTPGSPYSFPSPVTTSSGPLTPTSSTRGGLPSKRRGRPPKQNGSLGRGFPPPTQTQIGDKLHRLSAEDQIQVVDLDDTDGPQDKSVFDPSTSSLSHRLSNTNKTFSDNSSLPVSSHRLPFRVNGEHSYQVTPKPGPQSAGIGNHHPPSWASKNDFCGGNSWEANKKSTIGLSRSNSTPTGITFSVSPMLAQDDSKGHAAAMSGGHGNNTPSFTINLTADLSSSPDIPLLNKKGGRSNSTTSSTTTPLINNSCTTTSSENSSNTTSYNYKYKSSKTQDALSTSSFKGNSLNTPTSSSSKRSHNNQEQKSRGSEVILYPRDSVNHGHLHHIGDTSSASCGAMDLSVGRGNSSTGQGLDLSLHNTNNTFSISGSMHQGAKSSSATFSRFKALDEDYDC